MRISGRLSRRQFSESATFLLISRVARAHVARVLHAAVGAGDSREDALRFDAMDLVAFVRLVSLGVEVLERSEPDDLVGWVLLRLADGRRLLLAERTYRDGTRLIVEPNEAELQEARRDPSAAWNSKRSELVAGMDDLRGRLAST